MENIELKCASLRAQIAATEARLSWLRKELEMAEKAASAESCAVIDGALNTDLHEQKQKQKQKWPLSADEYKRYGRQMIVPQIGLQGWCSMLPEINLAFLTLRSLQSAFL
jgi:adenylyltransferase/sulfurtransferase